MNLTKPKIWPGVVLLGVALLAPLRSHSQGLTSPYLFNFNDPTQFVNTDLGHENWDQSLNSYTNLSGAAQPAVYNGDDSVTLGGIAANSSLGQDSYHWYGNTIVTTQTFSSAQSWQILVDRVSVGAYPGAPGHGGQDFYNSGGTPGNWNNRYRSSIWLINGNSGPGATTNGSTGNGGALTNNFVMFSQDPGESGWEYNQNSQNGNSQPLSGGGGGRGQYLTNLNGPPTISGGQLAATSSLGTNEGNVWQYILYQPSNNGVQAIISFYVSTNYNPSTGTGTWILGASEVNTWLTNQTFTIALSGSARSANISDGGGFPNSVDATFADLLATPEPTAMAVAGFGGACVFTMRWVSRRRKNRRRELESL